MGAPAVWPTRIFEYNDPVSALTGADSGGASKLVIGSLRAWIAVPMSLCQYLLAMAAVANIMTTSIELGQKVYSILEHDCIFFVATCQCLGCFGSYFVSMLRVCVLVELASFIESFK